MISGSARLAPCEAPTRPRPVSAAPQALPDRRRGGIGDEVYGRVQPFLPALRGFLRRRVAASDVEDVIQDILVRLVRRDPIDAIESPKRYLFQVAQATLIDRHRRDVSRSTGLHCELAEAHHPRDEFSPHRILEGAEAVRTAHAILAGMPPRRREILLAARIEGCSQRAIAHRYGISTSAVEKHLARALQDLSEGFPAGPHRPTMLRAVG